MMKPVIGAACMNCTLSATFQTRTEAVVYLGTHLLTHPSHRPLISDARNGWHAARPYMAPMVTKVYER